MVDLGQPMCGVSADVTEEVLSCWTVAVKMLGEVRRDRLLCDDVRDRLTAVATASGLPGTVSRSRHRLDLITIRSVSSVSARRRLTADSIPLSR